MKRNRSSILFLSSSLSILLLCLFTTSNNAMADSPSSSEAKLHIVYTIRPQNGVDAETFNVKTLASVFGSEEAAKKALIYTYKHAATGFSASLTPQQVAKLSKQPGVLQVVPSRTYQLQDVNTRI